MSTAPAPAAVLRPGRSGRRGEGRVLIVKLSSLGDVVHAMPAVQDVRRAWPNLHIDWVVERAFAPLVARCEGVEHIIPIDLRRWRKAPFAGSTCQAWRAFREDLSTNAYDVVVDLQGLSKSALVARLAHLKPLGRRYAMANRTEGSGYEAPTRWVADVAIRLEPHVHAVQRARLVCAQAFSYQVEGPARFGLVSHPVTPQRATVALVHGSSRADKQWPRTHWLELGRMLNAQGFRVALVHGNDSERVASEAMAQALPDAEVWPAMELDRLIDHLAGCAGVVGVDSGISHIAVALDVPHLQIYNFDTAWRTGPQALGARRQISVYATPHPTIDAVWQEWETLAVQP